MNLVSLELGYNQISDITALANLVGLSYLSLDSNQISDIGPLVINEGIGDFDFVYLFNNPLNDISLEVYITQLTERGASVYFNYIPSPTPQNVQAQYQPSESWNYITWDEVPGATEYHVYWGTSADVTTGSEPLTPTTTTDYEHPGVIPGWTYYYRVASVVDGVESELSEVVSVYVSVTYDRPTVTVFPSIGSKSAGTLLNEPGYAFTPNSTITMHFIDPNGVHSEIPITTDSYGKYSHYYLCHDGTAEGVWEYYAVDDTTGTVSDSVLINIIP